MQKQHTQKQKAVLFRALHQVDSILLLPNAWDAISAKMFELAGFKVVGTTSAGISSVLGYADGENMAVDEMLFISKRIVNSINLPLSVDIEFGYGNSVEEVVNTAKRVLEIGAVGINIEDSAGTYNLPLIDKFKQAEKIRAIREMAENFGVDLFINARTDAFLLYEMEDNKRLDETLTRANIFLEAGADCIFVPDMGNLNRELIKILIKEIKAPLNVIAGEHLPQIKELEDMGVARISFGPRPMRALLSIFRDMLQKALRENDFDELLNSSISYGDVNNWFANT